MAQTSSVCDYCIIWSPSVTLPFNLPEQKFQMNNCARLFWHPCINVEVMVHASSIYDHFIIWRDLQPTRTNVSNGTWPSTYLNKCFKWHCYSSKRTTVPNYFEIHKQMLKLWPWQDKCFTILSFDLQVWPWPSTHLNKFSNGTATHQGEQLCKVILKSMHKCRSFGPDKLNLWPSYHLTFKCDLDLQPTWKNFPMALPLIKENNCANLFWNPCINVEVMSLTSSIYNHFYHLTFKCDLDLQLTWSNISNGTSTPQGKQLCHIILKLIKKCRSYGQDQSGWTHTCMHNTRTHIHRTEVVMTMSCSLQGAW